MPTETNDPKPWVIAYKAHCTAHPYPNQFDDFIGGWNAAASHLAQGQYSWRPIVEAPRDGSYVLVWSTHGREPRTAFQRLVNGYWQWFITNEVKLGQTDPITGFWEPTVFMRNPTPNVEAVT